MLEVSNPAVQSLPGRQGVDNVGDLHQVVVLHPDSGDLPGPPGQHRPESRLLHLDVQDSDCSEELLCQQSMSELVLYGIRLLAQATL